MRSLPLSSRELEVIRAALRRYDVLLNGDQEVRTLRDKVSSYLRIKQNKIEEKACGCQYSNI